MKWNKKYNYPSSTRSVHQGFRHYALNNQMLPSVTSIIEMTKTDKEKARSEKSKAELNKQINDFINSDKVEDIKSNSVSKDEAKSKVKQFFA